MFALLHAHYFEEGGKNGSCNPSSGTVASETMLMMCWVVCPRAWEGLCWRWLCQRALCGSESQRLVYEISSLVLPAERCSFSIAPSPASDI
eukprot:2776022-Rhodomonas_salina.3